MTPEREALTERIWFDTEFIEDGRTIDLLSIGLVRADGEQYYAECAEADHDRASDWVRANVLPHLRGGSYVKSRQQISDELVEFCGARPEFWAYYADYDWIALCQLFGTMMDLPKGWPMYCRDVKQLCDSLGNPKLPPQDSTEHNALNDAMWTRQAWEALTALRQEAGEPVALPVDTRTDVRVEISNLHKVSGAETPRVTLSCGCQSSYFGFPSEWDTETREGESAIAHGVLCERHFEEYSARPEGTAALAAAREDAERVKREGIPGVMHPVDKSFYELTVKQRDAAWRECELLTARAAAAEAALGRERERVAQMLDQMARLLDQTAAPISAEAIRGAAASVRSMRAPAPSPDEPVGIYIGTKDGHPIVEWLRPIEGKNKVYLYARPIEASSPESEMPDEEDDPMDIGIGEYNPCQYGDYGEFSK